MANTQELIAAIAEQISFPLASAVVYGRTIRETGFLSQRGRGRHAVAATAEDAANLIIALVACPSPARAPEYVRDFGGLICNAMTARSEEGHPDPPMIFSEGQTFRDGIASLIAALGRPSFAEAMRAAAIKLPNGGIVQPHMSIEIRDTLLSGSVIIPRLSARYAHKSFADLGGLVGPELKRAVEENAAAVGRYYRGVKSVKAIDEDVLIPIAACVNGVSFLDLLADAADPEQLRRGYSSRIGVDGYPIDERHPFNRGAE